MVVIHEVEKSKSLNTVNIIDYVTNAVVIKTILKKETGSIKAMAVDTGEGIAEKTIPFDSFIQIIDGEANIIISGHSYILNTGQSIVVPAHVANFVKPNRRFKMMVTTIKCGY